MPPPRRPLLTIIGSLNIDLITRLPRVPQAGETLLTSSYTTGCGGKGANQAVACARLSRHHDASTNAAAAAESAAVDVEMIGAVGNDAFGTELVDSLRQNGVDVGQVQEVRGEKTGVAVIVVEEKTGENRILMSPNANFCLRPEDFGPSSTVFGTTPSTTTTTITTTTTRITSTPIRRKKPSLLILQLEIPLPTTLAILSSAQHHHIPVLLNPAPAQPLPASAYAAITHLVVNETEAAIITNTTTTTTSSAEGEGGISPSTLTALIALRVPHVIVTLGAKGVLYLNTAQRLVYEVEAEKVEEVRDTTAAGDTFVGAYAVAVAQQQQQLQQQQQEGEEEMTVEAAQAAISWANRAAAVTVQREGAQGAIPWKGEVPLLEAGGVGRWRSVEEWMREH